MMPLNFLAELSERVSNALRPNQGSRLPTTGFESLAKWTIENFDFNPGIDFLKTNQWRRIDNMDGKTHLQSSMTFWDRTVALPHHGIFAITFDKHGFPTEALAVSKIEGSEDIMHWGTAPRFDILKGLTSFDQLESIRVPRIVPKQCMSEIAQYALETIRLPEILTMAPVGDWYFEQRPSSVIMKKDIKLEAKAQANVDFTSEAALLVEFDVNANPIGAWLKTNRRKPIAIMKAEELAIQVSQPRF